MDFLKIYRGYIQNFSISVEAVSQARKKASFEKFLLVITISKKNPRKFVEISNFLKRIAKKLLI